MSSDGSTVEDYAGLSVAARLAGALCVFTRWLEVVGIVDARVDACVEHMWGFLTVTPETFYQWYEVDSEVLGTLLDELDSGDLARVCGRAGVDPTELERAFEAVTEIVFMNLYTDVDDDGTLAELAKLESVVRGSGVRWPPARLFAASPFTERPGWGHAMTAREVGEWRRASW